MPLKLKIEIGLQLWMVFEVHVEKGKLGCELSKLHIGHGTRYPIELLLEEQASIAAVVEAGNEGHVAEPRHHGLRAIEIAVVEHLPGCISSNLDDKERAKRIGVYASARGEASDERMKVVQPAPNHTATLRQSARGPFGRQDRLGECGP